MSFMNQEVRRDRPSLSINDRIVWISDNGPEFGYVRWLGKLEDLGSQWMAGVEFDNPVGSGTGLYKDKQLFCTPICHASLVPIVGLLKASDFLEETPRSKATERNIPVKLSEYQYNNTNREGAQAVDLFEDHCRKLINELDPKFESRRKEKIGDRIHNIPIRIEGNEDRIKKTSSQSTNTNNDIIFDHLHQPNNNNDNPKASLYNHLTQKHKDVNSVISRLGRVNLNDNNYSYNHSLNLVPPPPFVFNAGEKNLSETSKHFLGKSKGIQGNNNSCYMDATLFSMFASTTLFDSLLYRPPNDRDIPEYEEIQHILRDLIVKPLREEYFVKADQVMLFRTMLEKTSTVDGLTDQEKDPEEFLNLLLGQILKTEPYLKLSSDLSSFFYQLIVEKDPGVVLPTVQDLCEQSFLYCNVRLREIPPCLLLQMPRFGRQYKMYSRIIPSLQLDITDLLEAGPRACGYRGKDCDNVALYECKDCFLERSSRQNTRLSSCTFCAQCFKAKHFGKNHSTGIESHSKTLLEKTPKDAISRYSMKVHSSSSSSSKDKDKEIPRIMMDLFAVLCIETSHYVCFVKCGQEANSPWCFFDSMADRRGEQDGYNIPEVFLFEDFAFWHSDKGKAHLLSNKDDKQLPELAKRLVCDAYLCFYQYNGLKPFR